MRWQPSSGQPWERLKKLLLSGQAPTPGLGDGDMQVFPGAVPQS